MRDLVERGGRLSTAARREPKARHGRQEERRLWALFDPEPNLNPRELIRLARFSTRWDKLSLLAHETCQTVSIL